MLFNSIQFLIFFPVVTALYFLLPHRYRWFMLLVASCVFYMAFIPFYIAILAITILIDYFAGIWIEDSVREKKKRFLILSIISTCLVLFVFKYYNFFNTNMMAVARALDLNYPVKIVNIILPIGLSFHTFQSLSYVIEVYRGNQKAERNFGIYSLYVMFYPQLVAGPIERPQNLLHQFYEKHEFEYGRVADGLKLMAWGMFKKVVIADRLAVTANQIFNAPHDYTGIPLIIGTVFFAFQIYCDFSGYSDIAIGAAQVMGFKLMDNFNRPYFSKSISEFWKRWHISLSTWFKDYLYIPLGGNRVPLPRMYLNLFITFVVSGLWHGANWTYIIWGALNGLYLICGHASFDLRRSFNHSVGLDCHATLLKYLRVGVTFGLTCFAWIFFRSNTLSDAVYIVTHLFPRGISAELQSAGAVLKYFTGQIALMGLTPYTFAIAAAAIGVLMLVHALQRHQSIRHFLGGKPLVVRWAVYWGLILGIFFFGVFGKNQFIYFQF